QPQPPPLFIYICPTLLGHDCRADFCQTVLHRGFTWLRRFVLQFVGLGRHVAKPKALRQQQLRRTQSLTSRAAGGERVASWRETSNRVV
ncbi:MAG: hypothetical protein ABI614_17375, partial [Planctomycetota bacterium]